MKLDFSKLDNLAYMGFSGKQENIIDKITEQGFKILENEVTPFDAPAAPAAPAPAADYNGIYRAAYDFHMAHIPPSSSAEYWRKTAEDMQVLAESYGNDPLLEGILTAVYEELERRAG